ncbi:hypothetical protein [Paenibacillus lactis]|uniref:hypothetical protein n=1 Tax=Paenibacillus lactis TaxID=228574 RepID=UPI0036B6D5FE
MSKEVKTFKTVDDILEYYGWRDAKKEEKKDVPDKTDSIPRTSQDRPTARDINK